MGVEASLSKEMMFTIICLYRHPKAKVDFYDQLKSLLKSRDSKNETLLIGDWNVNWDDKQNRKNLKRVTDSFDLEQLVEQPTKLTF